MVDQMVVQMVVRTAEKMADSKVDHLVDHSAALKVELMVGQSARQWVKLRTKTVV